MEKSNEQEKKADDDADDELEERKKQLRKSVEEIIKNEDIDPIAKAQLVEQAEAAEQQKLELARAQIEQNKNDQIRKINADTQRKISDLEASMQMWAVWLPPIPALLIGLVVFVTRRFSENATIVPHRRK